MGIAEIHWPIAKDELAKLLGVAKGTIGVLLNQHGPKKGVIFEPGVDYHKGWQRRITKFTKKGACKLAGLLGTEKARDFLRFYKAEPDKAITRKIKPEYFFLNTITYAIDGFTRYEKKCRIGNYVVDLFLPDIKIAIECDEFMHIGYDENKELFRQIEIEKLLECQFVRFDPYDENINKKIGEIINIIFSCIHNKTNIHKKDISSQLEEFQRWHDSEKEIRKQERAMELKEMEDALYGTL